MNATKAALKLAQEQEIDLAELRGSGHKGKIVLGDVRKAARTLAGGMPSDFDARARRIWRDVEAHLSAKGLWEGVYAELLERYIRCLYRAHDARAVEKREGGTSFGSQGQLVVHPMVKIARENEHDALDLAKELLITPAAQRRYEKEVDPVEDGNEVDVLGF